MSFPDLEYRTAPIRETDPSLRRSTVVKARGRRISGSKLHVAFPSLSVTHISSAWNGEAADVFFDNSPVFTLGPEAERLGDGARGTRRGGHATSFDSVPTTANPAGIRTTRSATSRRAQQFEAVILQHASANNVRPDLVRAVVTGSLMESPSGISGADGERPRSYPISRAARPGARPRRSRSAATFMPSLPSFIVGPDGIWNCGSSPQRCL